MTREYGLTFISDENLYKQVKETLSKFNSEMDLKKFNKNLVDPIKLTFEKSFYKLEDHEVINAEISRQLDKTRSNWIGYFHQNIFKYISNDWEVPKSGFDIVNKTQKIYIEMKNKHNTMNSSSGQKTYIKMLSAIIKEPTATCYLVEVIAAHQQNIVWETTVDKEKVSHDNIRRMSIDLFYEMVTGNKDSFKKLCESLPLVIEDVLRNESFSTDGKNTVLDELQKISPNILKSLYLETFKTYHGFDDSLNV